MSLFVAMLMGFLAGLLCALGGALKDSPYEGFSALKFPRSIVVGAFWGLVSYFIGIHQPIVAFVFSGYFERATVEGYKILRAKRPGKFELKDPSMLGARLSFRKEEGGGA